MSWWRRDQQLLDHRRLIADLQQISGKQVNEVVQARTVSEEPGRIAAFYRALRHLRATRRHSVDDAARRAKEGAWQVTRAAGLHDWSFAYAAFEAALALGTRDLLDAGDYERLVGPMAVAMPWLLSTERAAGVGPR